MQHKATQPDATGMHIVPIALLTRILTDTSAQIFFPFAPIFADGLGITPIQFGYLVSLRSIMGLFSPLFGEWADRSGYRVVLLSALVAMAAGSFVLGLSNGLAVAVIGVLLIGLGGVSFVPTLQAFSSETLIDSARARGMGVIEYAWALAGIVGLYSAGQLIEITSWRAPFLVIGALLLVMVPIFARIVPPTSVPKTDTVLGDLFVIRENKRGAWGMIIAVGLIAFSAMHTFISHGVWLFENFGLSSVQLGTVALAFGVVDLVGSGGVSFLMEKIGRKRSLLTASLLASVGFFALVMLSAYGFVAVMIGLLFVRFLFEYCIVGGMIVMSEQAPNQRAKITTISAAVSTTGIALAGLTGPLAFERAGSTGLVAISAVGYLGVFLALRYTLAGDKA